MLFNVQKKKINIFAAMTAISTKHALVKSKRFSSLNIAGIMCTAPQYIMPEQNGLFQHFKAIHDTTNLPLILYIHPIRTGCHLSNETIIRILNLKRFIAIKDATLDLEKPLRILPRVNVNMLTGNDSAVLSYYANGGKGCVSVISNIFPKLCKKRDNAWRDGKFDQALTLHRVLIPLYDAIFIESNPIGVKYAMYKMDLCSSDIILPLTFANKKTRDQIDIQLDYLETLEENV